MFDQLTRAQFRDQVRRDINQVPPIDDNTGVAGAQPTRHPYPLNTWIDKNLDKAVAYFSRKCKISGDSKPQQLPVAAQTALGPYVLPLQQIPPFGSVTYIERAGWIPNGQFNGQPLTYMIREQEDRTRQQWDTTPPGTPSRVWVEFGNLLIWPAPQTAGSLTLMVRRAWWTYAAHVDGEILDIIPTDYYPLVLAATCEQVCAVQMDDAVLSGMAQGFAAIVADGLPDMMTFFARRSRQAQSTLIPRVGRIARGSNR